MVGWHQSHANLAMTSGQGTLNLWGGLGLNTDWNWSFKAFAFPSSVKRV